MKRTLIEFTEPGSYGVKWEFDGVEHVITYGFEVCHYSSDLEACHQFGEAVGHALECAGKLDRE